MCICWLKKLVQQTSELSLFTAVLKYHNLSPTQLLMSVTTLLSSLQIGRTVSSNIQEFGLYLTSSNSQGNKFELGILCIKTAQDEELYDECPLRFNKC